MEKNLKAHSFQSVWESLQKTENLIKSLSQEADKRAKEADKRAKEADRRMKEIDRRMQESRQEADERAKEADKRAKEADKRAKEADKRAKEADKRFKKLEELFTGQWGKLIEALVQGDFKRILKERGMEIQDVAQNIEGHYKNQNYEFDIMATNGDLVILCEVKTTLKLNDVKSFIKKLECFDTWKPKYRGTKIYGSVAYLKASQGSARYAEKQGLFVIKAVGGSASIVNQSHFKPKVFSSMTH